MTRTKLPAPTRDCAARAGPGSALSHWPGPASKLSARNIRNPCSLCSSVLACEGGGDLGQLIPPQRASSGPGRVRREAAAGTNGHQPLWLGVCQPVLQRCRSGQGQLTACSTRGRARDRLTWLPHSHVSNSQTLKKFYDGSSTKVHRFMKIFDGLLGIYYY